MMKIDELLEGFDKICITGHVSPDGDCLGAALTLYSYIKKYYPEKEADIFLEPPTSKLSYLYKFDEIDSLYEKVADHDIIFCVDAASLERIGKAKKYFKNAKKSVNIDHHISNTEFADVNIVNADASSTCEVLFGMLDVKKLDRDMAICLYTGIIYDTGVFKYSSTSPYTMEVAARLMEFDIPTTFIIDESFYSKTFDENRIYGYAILNSTLVYDGKVIYSYVTKEKMEEFHVSKSELEGIVSQLRLTKGVECSIFVYDIGDGNCKASLRSGEYLDVNKVASVFGGGGHIRAAGCTMKGSILECIDKLVSEVGKYI